MKPAGLIAQSLDRWGVKLSHDQAYRAKRRAMDMLQGADQQKGLIPEIQSVSAHVEQHICVKHLYGNWKKKNPGLEFKEVMWSAARATTVPSWERAMLNMKGMKETAWKEMVDVSATYWSQSHFKTYSKCDLQVNNMCEAFNRAILEYRDKPIITLLEGIKHYLTKRIAKMKELMNSYNGDICPRIQLVLEKNKRNAAHWTHTWHGDDNMAIYGVANGIDTYVVNLKQETCACRKWDLTGIPCSHYITCIWQNKKKPEDYVSEYYRKDSFKSIYSHIIYPTKCPQLWPLDNQSTMNPPIMRMAIGRPKKMRNKANDEPRLKHGHNKRSCKGKTAADRAIPKGGNKKKIACGQKKKTKPNEVEIENSSQAPMATQPSQQ
ncbi:uncharacterized protein LOC131594286 [Vicia villosa]|uniref:uncharacterized protein LOC131594286 n=1 Tax=Vicia villosa TaxID=3911 RepID=UPI00273ABCB1|nr:uncharacterized protein LOC131594286 [Vicia villosa]